MTIRHEQMTSRLMARYGGAATVSVPGGFTGPEYDPTPLPPTVHTVALIETGAEQELVAGGVVQANDVVVAMAPHASFTPTTADTLTIGGKSYALLSVQPVRSQPDGAVIYFRLHGRA